MKNILLCGNLRFDKRLVITHLENAFPGIFIKLAKSFAESVLSNLDDYPSTIVLVFCLQNTPLKYEIPQCENVVKVVIRHPSWKEESTSELLIAPTTNPLSIDPLIARLRPLLDLSPPRIMLLAIDIETNGPSHVRNSILSIGWCIGDEDGNVLEKKRIDFQPRKGRGMNPYTQTSFWDKHPSTLEAISVAARLPTEAIASFVDMLDRYDAIYDLRILSDNPSFDIAFINEYICHFTQRLPLNYRLNKNGNYRPVFDTDSFNRAFLGQTHATLWTRDSEVCAKLGKEQVFNSDHLPENDAENIYKLHVDVLRAMNLK